MVNTIAETIAKINKAEDFTKRQDYIRKSAELLKIEEAGLVNLVNKFLREKIEKEENKNIPPPAIANENIQEPDEDILSLLRRDELHERAIVKCLIEFGLKKWNEEQEVADFILKEFLDEHLVDDPMLLHIMEIYKSWYQQGLQPTERNFLYYEDQQISASVVSIMGFPYELSPNWNQHYDGKIPTREDLYREEITSTVNYLKLRKIKKLIDQNQRDLETKTDPQEQLVVLQTHQYLKKMEMELLKTIGTVILK